MDKLFRSIYHFFFPMRLTVYTRSGNAIKVRVTEWSVKTTNGKITDLTLEYHPLVGARFISSTVSTSDIEMITVG
jgi:hypothetical protein